MKKYLFLPHLFISILHADQLFFRFNDNRFKLITN